MSDGDKPDDNGESGGSTDSFAERMTHYAASSIDATTGAWGERRRLASAMRKVIGRLLEIDAPEAELATAADALERYFEQLDEHPQSRKYEGWHEASASGDIAAFFDQSPLIGLANPLAPPIRIHPVEGATDRAEAEVYFGPAYEGPPGCVHGGFVAAAFDEVLGFANSLSGTPGMTASLKVDYRRPTPLLTDLRFEARLDRVEGRKKYTVGAVYAGDTLTAEAEGLFISIDLEKVQALREQRQQLEATRGDSD
jgi:acyl-coenzyme A thioesterase PaaI-like protein